MERGGERGWMGREADCMVGGGANSTEQEMAEGCGGQERGSSIPNPPPTHDSHSAILPKGLLSSKPRFPHLYNGCDLPHGAGVSLSL